MKTLWSILRNMLPVIFWGIILSVNSQNIKHPIIPQPVSYIAGKGFFTISSTTKIQIFPSSKELSKLSDFLAERLHPDQNISKTAESVSGKNTTIILRISETNELGREGYKLNVEKKIITLSANTGNGIFYGIQTLLQLLNAESGITENGSNKIKWRIPVCKITDYPRFGYRGMHLDVCRHMFPVEFIKKYIDLLATYKINNLHWHLTDDQGWRIEITKYPLLTEIGSKRSGSPVGKSLQNDYKPYGGYYTQAEAREIVEYAASRYVNIIPEIEMPGHAVAALAAYPELSCTGGPFEVMTKWGVSDDIFCAGNEDVFGFLEDVLNEIMLIFPSEYIHIGGDEAPKVRWDQCPLCQKRMIDLQLKNSEELQSYFTRRIEKFLNRNGRQIIGWDEILEGGLAPGATVMSWRGIQGGIDAAKLSHKVIMTPGSPCYFDHYQENPASEPLAFGGFNNLKKVYMFEPVPEALSAEEAGFILGSQGNLWTEYIQNPDQVEYMAFPRAIALAEVNWSAKELRNWPDFLNRLDYHLAWLEKKQVKFSKSIYNVKIDTEYDSLKHEMNVNLKSEIPGSKIFFCLNEEGHNIPDIEYKIPFKTSDITNVSAILNLNGKRPGKMSGKTIYAHEAYGKIAAFNTSYSSRYAAKGPVTLTDGCRANPNTLISDWLGFSGVNAEFLIDLEKEVEIKNINIGFLFNPSNWIFLPTDVEITLSLDGINFKPAEGMRPELLTIREPATIDYNQVQIATKARFVRIIAKNRGTCPPDHVGAGQNAWIFLDEIMVNMPDDQEF